MLTGKQKRYLRGEASLLNPVAIVGKEGMTAEVLEAIRSGLKANELVKVKVGKNSPLEPSEVVVKIEQIIDAEIVQKIGRNIVLFKAKSKESGFKLP